MFLQIAQRMTGHGETKKRSARCWRRSSRSCGSACGVSARSAATHRPQAIREQFVRAAAATGSFSPSARALLLAGNRRFSAVTFAAASAGGRSALTMLSASATRPCRPTTSARLARMRASGVAAVGAAQRLFGLAADLSTARRKARDWTAPKARRARSSARSHSTAAPPRAARVDRAPRPAPTGCASRDRQGVWARPSTSKACWKLPLSASARHSRRAAPCCRDGRAWPARAPPPPGHRCPVARSALPYCSAASASLGLAVKRSWAISRSRLGSAAGPLASALSPSEPVMSDGVGGLAAANPKTSVVATATPCK